MTSERRRGVVVGALVAALVGCALLAPAVAPSTHENAFDHELHVQQYELSCAECHAGAEATAAAGMPTVAKCRECHEEGEESTAAFFTALTTTRPADAPFVVYGARLGGEVIAPHDVHAKAGVSCAACHGDVGASKATDASVVPPMQRCVECHDQAAPAKNDCATCHRTLRDDVRPPSHGPSFLRAHGDQVRHGWVTGDSLKDETCGYCHRPDSCVACHQQEAPQSHNAFFVARGHGLLALNDRASCSACHQPDGCVRCHQESRPLSHVGAFGGQQSRHCVSCHVPVETQQGCGMCHTSTPSHAAATPMPPTHTLGMNCRQCHGAGQPLPHADNGMECTSCHR